MLLGELPDSLLGEDLLRDVDEGGIVAGEGLLPAGRDPIFEKDSREKFLIQEIRRNVPSSVQVGEESPRSLTVRMLLTSTKCLMPAFSVWRRILAAPSIEACQIMRRLAE